MTIYFAGPLFSRAERLFNEVLVAELRRLLPADTLLVPQEFGATVEKDEHFFRETFRRCMEALTAADAVVAIVDGPDADSGTCFEVGYAYAKGKPVIAVRTDFRALEEHGVNLMLSQSARTVLLETEAGVPAVAERIAVAVRALTGVVLPEER